MTDEKPTAEDFLTRLRTRTAPAHQQLEEIPDSKVLLSDSLTKEQYVHYLSMMYPVMRDVDENIYPLLGDTVPMLSDRKKAGLLAGDIELLYPGTALSGDLPFSNAATQPFSQAFALGIMYVTEGSTLGGRVILKNVGKVLGIDENSGTAFFTGYGNNTGPYWKTFVEALSTYGQTSGQADEVIAGAVFAFNRICEYFTAKTAN